jgi:hypothetical protein
MKTTRENQAMKTTNCEPGARPRNARRAAGVIATAALLAPVLAGCEVTNPGPVDDVFLNLPAAHQALVTGAERQLAVATGQIAYSSAFSAREIMPGGQTGNGGASPIVQAGRVTSSDENGQWGDAHQARWVAENAIARFTGDEAGTVLPRVLAEAYLMAGLANRLLGETYCEAVFDGGSAEPGIRYFERAEKHFTDAIATGGSQKTNTTAYAGRASVRVFLDKWPEAVSDAQPSRVPLDFAYMLDADQSVRETSNHIYEGNSENIVAWSVWNTWFEGYYEGTGDPRTPWIADPNRTFASASLSGYGPVPSLLGRKYQSFNDDFRIASGQEMVLIRAEGLLRQNQWPEAMTLINSLRTSLISDTTDEPLAPWVANSIADAWTFLKREHAIEVWLEGRRMGALRRWEDDQTPGEIDWPDYESISQLFVDHPPSECYPIPDSERDTNLNL